MASQKPWFVRKNEKTFGPFTGQQLKQLVKAGKIVPDTPVRRGEEGGWHNAQEVKGLFSVSPPTLAATAPPPPSAAATSAAVPSRGVTVTQEVASPVGPLQARGSGEADCSGHVPRSHAMSMKQRCLRTVFVVGFGLQIALLFIPAYHINVSEIPREAYPRIEEIYGSTVEEVFGTSRSPRSLTPLDNYLGSFKEGHKGWVFYFVSVFSAFALFILLAYVLPSRVVFVSGGLLCSFLLVFSFFMFVRSSETVDVYVLPRLMHYFSLALPLIGFFVRPPAHHFQDRVNLMVTMQRLLGTSGSRAGSFGLQPEGAGRQSRLPINPNLLVVGGIMGVIGIAVFVIGHMMYSSGYHVMMFESMRRGEAQMRTGSVLKYVGVGLGTVGFIIGLLSFAQFAIGQVSGQDQL